MNKFALLLLIGSAVVAVADAAWWRYSVRNRKCESHVFYQRGGGTWNKSFAEKVCASKQSKLATHAGYIRTIGNRFARGSKYGKHIQGITTGLYSDAEHPICWLAIRSPSYRSRYFTWFTPGRCTKIHRVVGFMCVRFK
ncbi:uncharacterized protein [Argopecten irradians]|uniref:uncharacterized protein isoform X1 n=1 Tax=Argopecten irradians TaxID=31199 RepID=UPI0037230904